jgi:putative methyltransferase (TIGR04325 family)
MLTQCLSFARDWSRVRRFRTASGRSSCRGVYDSYETALAACPRHAPTGFDHFAMAAMYRDDFMAWNPADRPIVGQLGKILKPEAKLFDLGGSVGMCYYAYRKFLTIPESAQWTVCDVPAAVEEGTRIARERAAFNLSFTSRREEMDGADILLTCGALQYIAEPLGAVLKGLKRAPRHLLINRVPFSEGKEFYTVQNQGQSYAPYKIANVSEFVSSLEALGYRKADAWNLERSCEIPFHPRRNIKAYYGFYFVRSR